MIFSLAGTFANFYSTVCLSIFDETSTMLAFSIFISLISLLIFNILPDAPIKNEKPKAKRPSEIFKDLISLFGDKRILSMYGLFATAACANGIPQSLLVVFYSKFLSAMEVQE